MDRYAYRIVFFLAIWWLGNSGFGSTVRAASTDGVARITQRSGIVQSIKPAGRAGAAALRDTIEEGSVLRTGKDGQAELTFDDQTVVRLASDTVFSFRNGACDLNLSEGAVLVESPKSGLAAKIEAGEISAAISGTTSVFEYRHGVCKFLVLEGKGRLYRPRHVGDSVLVGPGQMVFGNAKDPLSDPVDFDIARFIRTSHLIVDLPPLRTQGAIAAAARAQDGKKSKKTLMETNLVIHGGGTVVSLVNPDAPKASKAASRQSRSKIKR